ncbi:MAG: hypothetical protein MHPSP_001501, partial [Paramarteilia canceri]
MAGASALNVKWGKNAVVVAREHCTTVRDLRNFLESETTVPAEEQTLVLPGGKKIAP